MSLGTPDLGIPQGQVLRRRDVDKVLKLNVERLRARRAGVQQMLYNMLEGLSDEETEEFCEDILRSLESDGRPPSFAPHAGADAGRQDRGSARTAGGCRAGAGRVRARG